MDSRDWKCSWKVPPHLLPQTLSKAGHMMKFNKETEFRLLPLFRSHDQELGPRKLLMMRKLGTQDLISEAVK